MTRRLIPVVTMACLVASAGVASATALRDPTRRPVTAPLRSAAAEPAPVLSAIMGTPESRIAIFNGHVVRSGGSVGSYAIEAVFEDGVRYRHGGQTHELHLPHTATFKKPSLAPPRVSTGVH